MFMLSIIGDKVVLFDVYVSSGENIYIYTIRSAYNLKSTAFDGNASSSFFIFFLEALRIYAR